MVETQKKEESIKLSSSFRWINTWITKKKEESIKLSSSFGDPAGIRTPDPQLRRLLLYPAELRDHHIFSNSAAMLRLVFLKFACNVAIKRTQWKFTFRLLSVSNFALVEISLRFSGECFRQHEENLVFLKCGCKGTTFFWNVQIFLYQLHEFYVLLLIAIVTSYCS